MKKALTQTIIVFVAVNLITAGFALAQNVPDEENQETSKEALAAQKEAEIAAKVAEKEVEAAQKQIEAAQKQMGAAQQQMAMKMDMYDILEDYRAPRLSLSPWQQRDGGEVLVIPAAEMKIENLAAITEDMSVMSRIFDNILSQARLTTGGSWSIGFDSRLFGRSSGAIEAIYLEGYGALFLMKVNALLSPPPEALEEKETEEEDTDPLWTQLRQEIYAPEEVDRRRRGDRPEEKYDSEKVKELKETLIKTLKHAANIRNLKPDESVILTVIGKAGQSGTRTTTRSYGRSRLGSSISRGRSSIRVRGAPGVPTVAASLLPTVLTIRAKKSDIDAFAKGQLTFDQFRQKTQLLSYSYLGENIGDRPSRSSGIGGLGRSTNSRRRSR